MFGVGPSNNDKGKTVVGRCCRKTTARQNIGLETAIHRQLAPISIPGREQRRLLIICLRADRLRDARAPTIGAYYHGGVFFLTCIAGGVTLDADDPATLDNDFFDAEPLAHLRPSLRRSVDEQLVQHAAARTIGERSTLRARRTCDCERAKIIGIGMDRWTSGRDQAIE